MTNVQHQVKTAQNVKHFFKYLKKELDCNNVFSAEFGNANLIMGKRSSIQTRY